MGKIPKAVRTAYEAVVTLANVRPGEDVLIIADESGWEENGEIIDCLFGVVRQRNATPTLVLMRDVKPGAAQEYLPEAAKAGMRNTDVLIGITKTTAASVVHHPLPERLRAENKLRGIVMIKRSFEALTSPTALDPNRDEIVETGTKIRDMWREGHELHATSDLGTDFTMGIDEHEPWRENVAHEPGEVTTITWGEVVQGPTVGTTQGVATIDGPVLEFGVPQSPIDVHMADGNVVDIVGDDPMVDALLTLVEENDNAENIGEIAVGTNPIATASPLQDANIRKKALGSAHIAIGDGQLYGQSIESAVHIDLVMNSPTITIDGEPMFENGKMVL